MKGKGDTLSPREDKRMIKVRVTSRKKEEKGEKYKEEKSKKNQEKVIKTEPRRKQPMHPMTKIVQ